MTARPGTLLVVTGMSGAGKSTALHALEDLAFYCVDNLPVPLIEETLAVCQKGGLDKVALCVDVRVRSFLQRAPEVLEKVIENRAWEVSVLFLDASDEALLRRFSETRRPHPLSTLDPSANAVAVLDGIQLERDRLASLRARAGWVVDTTGASVHDLRRRIVALVAPSGEGAPMITRFLSFGFKYGMPADADLVFDVRFLDNPYFVKELRPKSGKDADVAQYVLGSEEAAAFVAHVRGLLDFLLPRYQREGKSYLTVAFGCTGGRHRSVALAEHFAKHLADAGAQGVLAAHRDIDRESKST